jgi:hypothetical protein
MTPEGAPTVFVIIRFAAVRVASGGRAAQRGTQSDDFVTA